MLECARGGLLREGRALTAARWPWSPTWAKATTWAWNFITTVHDVAVLKRVIVQNVANDGYAVLNAADPHVAAMASACPGKVIFFALDRHHP